VWQWDFNREMSGHVPVGIELLLTEKFVHLNRIFKGTLCNLLEPHLFWEANFFVNISMLEQE